jgi:hypothetical protein
MVKTFLSKGIFHRKCQELSEVRNNYPSRNRNLVAIFGPVTSDCDSFKSHGERK